jgi:hypothetical protein
MRVRLVYYNAKTHKPFAFKTVSSSVAVKELSNFKPRGAYLKIES